MKQRHLKILIAIALWVMCLPAMAQQERDLPVDNAASEFDTTRDDGYWKRALMHGKLNLKDTTVSYPGLIHFGVKCYRWFDRYLNTYDTAYIVGTRTKWKFTVKESNWLDSYAGTLSSQRVPIMINSNVTCFFGVHGSYSGLGLGYTINLNDLITGRRIKNIRWEFNFNTSRVMFEGYYSKDVRESNLHHLGKFRSVFKSVKFKGLSREYWGGYTYYIFNHMHYMQSAAYSFSRYQIRSSGSFIAGLHFSHQDFTMDFSKLDEELQNNLPDERRVYRFRYRDYSFLLGYGYNWAFRKRWLFNITALTGVGYRHSFPSSVEGKKDMLSLSFRVKSGLVLNRSKFFYGLQFISDGHLYHTNQYSFFNAIFNLNVITGFRF